MRTGSQDLKEAYLPTINRESAEEFLEETVRRLAYGGWLLSGRIDLIDCRVCPVCGTESLYTHPEHVCPVCAAPIRLALPVKRHPAWPILAQLVDNPSNSLVELAAQVAKVLEGEPAENGKVQINPVPDTPPKAFQGDAPICDKCGSLMIRTGICHTCLGCGATGGCG